jgi:hypothetical protein
VIEDATEVVIEHRRDIGKLLSNLVKAVQEIEARIKKLEGVK